MGRYEAEHGCETTMSTKYSRAGKADHATMSSFGLRIVETGESDGQCVSMLVMR